MRPVAQSLSHSAQWHQQHLISPGGKCPVGSGVDRHTLGERVRHLSGSATQKYNTNMATTVGL